MGRKLKWRRNHFLLLLLFFSFLRFYPFSFFSSSPFSSSFILLSLFLFFWAGSSLIATLFYKLRPPCFAQDPVQLHAWPNIHIATVLRFAMLLPFFQVADCACMLQDDIWNIDYNTINILTPSQVKQFIQKQLTK